MSWYNGSSSHWIINWTSIFIRRSAFWQFSGPVGGMWLVSWSDICQPMIKSLFVNSIVLRSQEGLFSEVQVLVTVADSCCPLLKLVVKAAQHEIPYQHIFILLAICQCQWSLLVRMVCQPRQQAVALVLENFQHELLQALENRGTHGAHSH